MTDKKTLSERDICSKYITPAITGAGWDLLSQIREEVSFTKWRQPVAFSVMIEVIKFPSNQPMLRLDAHWWNPQELINDVRFEYSNETGSYADYTASLSIEEFLQMHNKYKNIKKDSLDDSKVTRAAIATLENIVELIDGEYDTIKVTAYEWESGYD